MNGSHLAWATGYQAASRHEVDIVGLPGELWRWRLRGGALPLADKIINWIAQHGQPDLLLISGLVDVAELLGLVRRQLSNEAAVVVYQHESQLVYPVADGIFDQGAALRNWMSWCAADLVLFNSYYHLRAVGEALPGFINNLPDKTHLPKLDEVVSKFEVFPVGVDLAEVTTADDPPANDVEIHLDEVLGRPRDDEHVSGFADHDSIPEFAPSSGPPVILWPHRWERDKDPASFLRALDKVVAAGLEFRLVLAGQDPPSGSASAAADRAEVAKRFEDWTLSAGELGRPEYLAALRRCDLVVSCARHEFFGVAVVEAIASGCVPLLPDDLSYPELIRAPWHDAVLYEPGTFGTRLVDAVARIDELRGATVGLSDSMRRFGWEAVGPVYDERFDAIVNRLGSTPALA
jgi:glycosyltransferase involved in cell wall biosynthesis